MTLVKEHMRAFKDAEDGRSSGPHIVISFLTLNQCPNLQVTENIAKAMIVVDCGVCEKIEEMNNCILVEGRNSIKVMPDV